jgi:O-antigen/teichoic acid export membrane protein
MLAGLSTIELVGAYGAGQFLASLPELLGSYAAVAMTPHLVAAMRGDLGRYYRRAQPALLLAAFIGYLALLAFWDSLIAPFFPAQYRQSGEIAFILMPAAFAAFATVPLALSVVMMERRRALATLDALLLPFVIAAYLVAIQRWGASGAAMVASATSLIRSAAVQAIAWRIAASWRTSPQG